MSQHAEGVVVMFCKLWAALRAFAATRLGIRTWEDLRLQVHVLSPYAANAVVTWGWATEDRAKLIVGVVMAALSPYLAVANTRDGFRKWVYALLPPVQAFIVGVGWATDTALTPVMALVVAVLGGGLAAVNTRTSTDPRGADTRKAAAS